MEKVRYHEMLPHEIVKRRKVFPAAFIGLGGLEWHGEHLAVGNDALKAEKLCELAAARSGGFAFPTVWYGEPRTENLLDATVDNDGRVKAAMKFKKRNFTPAGFGKSNEEQVAFYTELLFHTLMQMHQKSHIYLLCETRHFSGFHINLMNKVFKIQSIICNDLFVIFVDRIDK